MESIIIYSGSHCFKCKQAKGILDKEQIPYIDKDVRDDRVLGEARKYVISTLPIMVYKGIPYTYEKLPQLIATIRGDA